jgi:hypothetical protein
MNDKNFLLTWSIIILVPGTCFPNFKCPNPNRHVLLVIHKIFDRNGVAVNVINLEAKPIRPFKLFGVLNGGIRALLAVLLKLF